MREMQKNGAEYGNHSLSHPFLLPQSGESDAIWKNRISKELLGAQKRLQTELGEETNERVKLFSYPFGEYNAQMAEFIAQLGYTGVSQTSGPIGQENDLLALPRFAMAEAFADPDGFIVKLSSLPLPISSVSPWEPVVNNENPPSLRIKLKRHLKGMKCYLGTGEEVPFEWISQSQLKIQAKEALRPPRERYTCTAPAGNERYYWYSHLWIIKSR
jgi:hypothetical protein